MIQPGARNSEFLDLDDDSLYHLGLKKTPELLNQLREIFGDVKYVCPGWREPVLTCFVSLPRR